MVPQTPSLMPHKISLFVLGGWVGGYTFSYIIKIMLVPFDIAKLPIVRWEKLTLNINCCTYHDLVVNKHTNSILKLRLVSDISLFFFFVCLFNVKYFSFSCHMKPWPYIITVRIVITLKELLHKIHKLQSRSKKSKCSSIICRQTSGTMII